MTPTNEPASAIERAAKALCNAGSEYLLHRTHANARRFSEALEECTVAIGRSALEAAGVAGGQAFAVDAANYTEYGWLIENGKQGDELRYRSMEHGVPTWTEDHDAALRFARRRDAELFAEEDDGAWRIAEHGWHAHPESAARQDATYTMADVRRALDSSCLPQLVKPLVLNVFMQHLRDGKGNEPAPRQAPATQDSELARINAELLDEVREALGLKGKPGSVVEAARAMRATIDAQGVNEADLVSLIAHELASIDGYNTDDANCGLFDMRWHGNPSEPLGDVWNMEYIPRAERVAKAIRRRFTLPATDDTRLLGELLAVIHGDGGHYREQHGTAKAVEDAIAKVCNERIAVDEWDRRDAERYRQLRDDARFLIYAIHTILGTDVAMAGELLDEHVDAALAATPRADEGAKEGARWRAVNATYQVDGEEVRCHVNVGINVWKDGEWCSFHQCSPEELRVTLSRYGITTPDFGGYAIDFPRVGEGEESRG